MELEQLAERCAVTDHCLTQTNLDGSCEDGDELLSVVLCYDHPFDAVALDEALFSLAVQEHEHLEVVLVFPECGPAFRHRAEAALLAQPWPEQAQARMVSVATRASRTISAELLNAGSMHSTGRYLAFLHHQDLVYQHTYRMLLERLRTGAAALAFGGVRIADHVQTNRHWLVTSKKMTRPGTARLAVALGEQAPIHSFVADRDRLAADTLFAQNATSRLAVTLFLLRLALHPKADFELADKKMFESRMPPTAGSTGLGRIPTAKEVLTFLAKDAVRLRPDALCAETLLAGALQVLNAG